MYSRSLIRLRNLLRFNECSTLSPDHLERDFSLPRSLHLQPQVAETSSHLCSLRERQVEIETCGELYKRWRAEKRFWKVSKSGLRFKVRYLDTEDVGEKDAGVRSPVVLALHGSPGSYDDFNPLTLHLHKRGVRVIAPCFPNYHQYKPGVFRHSTEEKFEYIKDFLGAVNVSKVDMLLCNSSSIFPGLMLCQENHFPVINSLCLLNPTSFGRLRVLQPYWWLYTIMRIQEFPAGRELSIAALKLFLKKKNLNSDVVFDQCLSAFTMIFADFRKGEDNFKELLARDFPIFLAFSENDKLIDKDTLYQMANMMVNHSDIARYDGYGNLVEEGGRNSIRRAVAFQNGSHFLLKKYPDAVIEEVTTFLFQRLNSIHRSL